jgi:Domain of unknown function (DUF4263)
MKAFEKHTFDLKTYAQELQEFKDLLDNNVELSEKKDILPFFKQRRELSCQIATLHPQIIRTERIAYEFDVFGDFKSDLVIGDSKSNTYCFIEFEDAKKDSIFVNKSTKYKPEFSPRLEHGLSQIIDWFYKIDGLQNTDDMEERFGENKINYGGILVIGRSAFLTPATKKRFEWRSQFVLINSRSVLCYTFDELYDALNDKFQFVRSIMGDSDSYIF